MLARAARLLGTLAPSSWVSRPVTSWSAWLFDNAKDSSQYTMADPSKGWCRGVSPGASLIPFGSEWVNGADRFGREEAVEVGISRQEPQPTKTDLDGGRLWERCRIRSLCRANGFIVRP